MKNYKYKTVKIPIKYDDIRDDTSILNNITKSQSLIASFLDNEDLNNQINQYAKDGWKLFYCEKGYDIESEIVGFEKIIIDEYHRKNIAGYEDCEKLPDSYDQNRYKRKHLYYYLCIFEKEE